MCLEKRYARFFKVLMAPKLAQFSHRGKIEDLELSSKLNGALERIRTPDLSLRRGAIYPADLQARFINPRIIRV